MLGNFMTKLQITDAMIAKEFDDSEITPMGVYQFDGMYMHPAAVVADWEDYEYVGSKYLLIPKDYDDGR